MLIASDTSSFCTWSKPWLRACWTIKKFCFLFTNSKNQQIKIENYDSDGTEDSVEKLFQEKNVLSDLKYYQQEQEHKHKRFYSFNQCQNDCCLYNRQIGNFSE